MQLFQVLLFLTALLATGCGAAPQSAEAEVSEQVSTTDYGDHAEALQAFEKRASDVWISGKGQVKKMLADDNKGARHQRFLVGMENGKTLLFAHNVDLAPRIDSLQAGDTVEYRGEYEFNPKGGVVHWTHHDPKGNIEGGWLKHNGKLYE